MAEGHEKREVVAKGLEQDGETYIVFDPRQPGVVIPQHVTAFPWIALRLSHNYDLPQIEITQFCFRATLSFHGIRFRVQVPWYSVFKIVLPDGQSYSCDPPKNPGQETMDRKTRFFN